MILNNETDILKELTSNTYNIHYIYGNENYLKRLYYNKIINLHQIDINDTFNFHEFSFQKSDIDEIIDACLALPVFSQKKCVVVKDIEISNILASDMDKLVELIDGIPEECVLIILQLSVDVDDKKNAKDKKFIKAIDKQGLVLKFSSRSETNVVKFIVEFVKKRDLSISPNNAKQLISRCGSSFDVLSTELEKLCAYEENSNEISFESIDKLVKANLDTSIFELSKSINQQDYPKAMNILSQFEQMQEQPVMVFNVLSSVYVDLFRAKAALEDGYGSEVISQSFNYRGRDFLIRNALSDARNSSWYFIAGALAILRDADLELKGGTVNGYITLEKTVAKLFVLKADGR